MTHPPDVIVRKTHRQLSRLLRHEQAPLTLAQRCSGVPPPAPLFSSLLNYRRDLGDAVIRPERSPAWDGIQTLSAEEHTNYPLTLTIDDQQDGVQLTVEVDRSVNPHRICGYMHEALESLVEALESGSDWPARTLQVIPESERNEILVQWNGTAEANAHEPGIIDLFEAQVRQTPAATAVEDAGTALTYAELNVLANRFAHYCAGAASGRAAGRDLCRLRARYGRGAPGSAESERRVRAARCGVGRGPAAVRPRRLRAHRAAHAARLRLASGGMGRRDRDHRSRRSGDGFDRIPGHRARSERPGLERSRHMSSTPTGPAIPRPA